MNPIRASIQKPVSVAVGVILLVMFGLLSLWWTPIQLTPDIIKPEVTIETRWPGASPYEVEREIVMQQEDQLKSIEGLEKMTSESFEGLSSIVLQFPAGTDMNVALLRVSNRLQQVPDYPDEAEEPVIFTSNRRDNAMAWFVLKCSTENRRDIDSYYELCDDFIRVEFERIPGVSSSNFFGGMEQEVRVMMRPEDLAARGLTVPEVLRAIDTENANVSAGDFDEGKYRFLVRTLGEYQAPEDIENIVIEARDGRRVYLRDFARVEMALKKKTNFARQKEQPCIAINALRQPGANVITAMEEIKAAAEAMNQGRLKEEGVFLEQVYDETTYIHAAIDLVYVNLIIGSVLAIGVLFLFLRSLASTFIIALAIPISIIGAFILMFLLGRNINVISLAGMSFAAGMVVDCSIVTLENIYRLRQGGKTAAEAAEEGVRGVWGAIFASTMTTIAVFAPVVFIQEQAGQLFMDIAIAISCSVGLSLLVSTTVIPCLASRLMRGRGGERSAKRHAAATSATPPYAAAIAALTALINRSTALRLLLAGGLTVLAIVLTVYLMPGAEYLPVGNRNLAIGIILPPPGYSLKEISDMGARVEEHLAPHWSESPGDGPPAEPRIENFFFVARDRRVFMGTVGKDPEHAGDLVPLMLESLGHIPGVIPIAQQVSLFTRGLGTGRSIDIEITGPDLEKLVEVGRRVFAQVLQLFPLAEGHQARPVPSLDLLSPELHVLPRRERARDLGLTSTEIGTTVDAILDGIRASKYRYRGREIDITLTGEEPGKQWRTQEFADLPIAAPGGRLVTLGSVADITVTGGPEQVNHIERNRAITVQLIPSPRISIEKARQTIENEVVAPLAAGGELGRAYNIHLSGTVDDLRRALGAFTWNFIIAIAITYLLMAALFESFLYPLIVMVSVPLAAVGGVLFHSLVNRFIAPVTLDIVTMLGFVILIGTAVNNAILLVDRALENWRRGMPVADSVADSVRTRVRPIFMTTFTTVIGMMPLVLFPGSGSELYRGLGSVVLGGLLVSMVFTLFLIPAALSLLLDLREWLLGPPAAAEPGEAAGGAAS